MDIVLIVRICLLLVILGLGKWYTKNQLTLKKLPIKLRKKMLIKHENTNKKWPKNLKI